MGKDCNRRGFRSTNFLYVVILCLLLSPATGFAQTKRINLELKNVTVQEAVTFLADNAVEVDAPAEAAGEEAPEKTEE